VDVPRPLLVQRGGAQRFLKGCDRVIKDVELAAKADNAAAHARRPNPALFVRYKVLDAFLYQRGAGLRQSLPLWAQRHETSAAVKFLRQRHGVGGAEDVGVRSTGQPPHGVLDGAVSALGTSR